MRILQIGPFPPPHGGVQTHLKAIHDRLPELGHEGMVVAITRASVTEGVPNTFKPGTAFSLLWHLFTLKYDLLHLHLGGELTNRLIMLMLLCGMLPSRKCVITFHSGGYAANEGASAKRNSLRAIAFRSADHVIAVNRQMVDMLLRFGVKRSRVSLIPPFVAKRPPSDVELDTGIKEFVEARSPLLLSVSLLEPEYALDIQLEAFGRVLEKHPNAGLLMAGSGSLSEELTTLISTKPFKEHVLLTGDVEHGRALRLIELADILLRPTYYDGDAVSIREALYLGTPVIATDNGMRPEGVILVPLPPDPAQLAQKVMETLNGQRPVNPAQGPDGSENIESVITLYERLTKSTDD